MAEGAGRVEQSGCDFPEGIPAAGSRAGSSSCRRKMQIRPTGHDAAYLIDVRISGRSIPREEGLLSGESYGILVISSRLVMIHSVATRALSS